MIVTFITIYTPSSKGGAPVRIYNLIKETIRQGVTVDLICLAKTGESIHHLGAMLGIRKVVAVSPVNPSLFSRVRGVLLQRIPPYFTDYRCSGLSEAVISYLKETKPDIIQLELLHSYDAVASIMPALKATKAKIILDAHNAEYNVFKESIRTFSWIKYAAGSCIAPNLLSIEKKAAREVDYIFTCSELDKSFFAKIAGEEKITVIPNGVDCSIFNAEPLATDHSLIFMGGMNYPPNDDALRFYFHDIHPLVKKKVPDVKITLLGGEPSPWLKNIMQKDPNIFAPGLVPDVRKHIRSSRLCISPMRKGSGTSLKILEYMGSGKPIVSTRVGVRGISCADEKEALIIDDSKGFADAIIRLIRDNELASRLGENARKTAESFYDWKIVGKIMVEKYHKLISE